MDDVISVLTSKSLETIFSEGGTGIWKASPERIESCRYVICVRNAHSDWVEDAKPHSVAFLIGRKLKAILNPEDGRYFIAFEEYSEIEIANFWTKQRNPVAYQSRDVLKDKLDLNSIIFKPFPKEKIDESKAIGVKPLTIAEAKNGIAKSLGIPVEAIEIIIRA